MKEINKLRQRLSNINKNVREYRMTVIEAQALLSECDFLIEANTKKELDKVAEVVPLVTVKIMDGGTF